MTFFLFLSQPTLGAHLNKSLEVQIFYLDALFFIMWFFYRPNRHFWLLGQLVIFESDKQGQSGQFWSTFNNDIHNDHHTNLTLTMIMNDRIIMSNDSNALIRSVFWCWFVILFDQSLCLSFLFAYITKTNPIVIDIKYSFQCNQQMNE